MLGIGISSGDEQAVLELFPRCPLDRKDPAKRGHSTSRMSERSYDDASYLDSPHSVCRRQRMLAMARRFDFAIVSMYPEGPLTLHRLNIVFSSVEVKDTWDIVYTTDPVWKKRRPLRPVRTPPAHPSAARASCLPRIPRLPPCKRSTEGPGAPTLQAVYRGPRSTHLASSLPRIPRLRPVALRPLPRADGTPRIPRRPLASGMPRTPRLLPVPTGKPTVEDAGAPTGGLGPPSHGRGRQGRRGILGRLGVDGERRGPRRPGCPWRPRRPWMPRGRRRPWSPWSRQGPRGRRGASGSLDTEVPSDTEAYRRTLETGVSLETLDTLGSTGSVGIYNCKNGFWSVLENHRFLKKSRKSYQNFRNNSKSQTMKSAQDFFYRFWDRAIMTQSIIAVFTNRGGASAQYRTKKVSHN